MHFITFMCNMLNIQFSIHVVSSNLFNLNFFFYFSIIKCSTAMTRGHVFLLIDTESMLKIYLDTESYRV